MCRFREFEECDSDGMWFRILGTLEWPVADGDQLI
jgi:hypothetical protein